MWKTEHSVEKNWHLLFYENIIETKRKEEKKERKKHKNLKILETSETSQRFKQSFFLSFIVQFSRRDVTTTTFHLKNSYLLFVISDVHISLSNVINYAYVSWCSNDLLKISLKKSYSSSKRSNVSINLKQFFWALLFNSLIIEKINERKREWKALKRKSILSNESVF